MTIHFTQVGALLSWRVATKGAHRYNGECSISLVTTRRCCSSFSEARPSPLLSPPPPQPPPPLPPQVSHNKVLRREPNNRKADYSNLSESPPMKEGREKNKWHLGSGHPFIGGSASIPKRQSIDQSAAADSDAARRVTKRVAH